MGVTDYLNGFLTTEDMGKDLLFYFIRFEFGFY